MRSYLQWAHENRPFDRKGREDLGRFMSNTYSPVRPGGKYPVYELDSIDLEQIRHGKLLNDASIVWQDRPHGFLVGDLTEARIRFTEVCDVHTEWGLDP